MYQISVIFFLLDLKYFETRVFSRARNRLIYSKEGPLTTSKLFTVRYPNNYRLVKLRKTNIGLDDVKNCFEASQQCLGSLIA